MERRAQVPRAPAGARRARRAAAWPLPWLAAAVLAGCAAGGAGGDAPPEPDAGAAIPHCLMRVAITPEVLRAPVSIEAAASIDSIGLTGIHSYEWSVSLDDAPLSVTPLAGGAAIGFAAEAPGTYQVILEGAVGDEPCLDAVELVNVADPGVEDPAYRLRALPGSGQSLPIQELAGSVLAGGDVALGTLVVSPGVAVTGRVESESGAPLAAYVRAVPRGAAVPWRVEGFSGADGALSLRLEDARHDVLVVPVSSAGGHAPVLLTDVLAAPSWTLRVPAAPELAGTVVAHQEPLPVAGAQVAVHGHGMPAVLATTDADGAFTAPVRAGGAGITVVPLADSGLPWLELPYASGLDGSAGSVEIAYDPGLERVTFTATSPAPMPHARVTWIARPIPGAGTLSGANQSPVPLTGTLRLPVSADAAGAWPEISLPRALYDVILEPADPGADHGVTLIEVDLRAGEPPALTPAAAATLTGAVVDADGAAVAGAEVVAVPAGLLAQSPDAGASAVTAEDGSFALAVTGGGSYELVLDSLAGNHGRVRRPASAPAPGQVMDLGEIPLPRAFAATGRLVLHPSGAAASGVTVQLVCAACAGPEAVPVAEAVTDAFGSFALRVPALAATAP